MTSGWAILPRKSDRQNGKILRACIAELFGTFSVVFWGVGASAGANTSSLTVAAGFGLATAMTFYMFHCSSGAHFNPAVSLAMFTAQKISLVRCIVYWVMQILGACLGSGLSRIMTDEYLGVVSLREQFTRTGVDPSDIAEWQGFLLELFGTLALIFTYLATHNPNRSNRQASYDLALSVGVVMFVVHLTLFPLTGCGVNPARALMVNAIATKCSSEIWLYIIAPLLAGLLGGFSHEIIFSYLLDYPTTSSTTRGSSPRLQNTVLAENEADGAVGPNDIVLSNKINGELAYE